MLGLAIRLMVIALQLAGSIAAQSTALAQIFGAGVDARPDAGDRQHPDARPASRWRSPRACTSRRRWRWRAPTRSCPWACRCPPPTSRAWGTARVAQAFALGFSLAAPFVIAGFAYNLALGAINRAMPQLMVAFIGAPAITAGGLLILMLAAPVILHFWGAQLDQTLADPLVAAAMSEESGGEKVFDPTPQKLAEARRKGDIPRSTDVTAAATYLALLAVVGTAGAFALDRAASVLMVFIAQPDRLAGPHPRAGRAAALRRDPDRGAGGAGAVLPGADRGGAGQPLRPAGDHLLRRQARAQARRASRSSPTPSASSAPPGSSSSPRRRSSSPPSPSRSSSISRATSTG